MLYDGSKEWRVLGDGLKEYARILYFNFFGFWIGLGVRWAVNGMGQVTPSPFSHAMAGTYPVRYYRFWYFTITICNIRGRK